MENIEDGIIGALLESSLLAVLSELYYKTNNRSSLYEAVAELHKNEKINFIKDLIIPDAIFSSLEGYAANELIRQVIPKISSNVEEIIHFIKSASLAINLPVNATAFMYFLESNQNQIDKALDLVTYQKTVFTDFIPAVLIAGSSSDIDKYQNEAIRLLQDDNDVVKLKAVFAIGELKYPSEKCAQKSLAVLTDTCWHTMTDDFSSSGFRSLIKVSSAYSIDDLDVLNVMREILHNCGPSTLREAAYSLAFKYDVITAEVRKIIITRLESEDVMASDLIDLIDIALVKMIESDQSFTTSFLESMLIKPEVSTASFDGFVSYLAKNKTLLNAIVTRWLLSRNQALCNAVQDIIDSIKGMDGEEIRLEINEIEIKDRGVEEYLFLAKKAVGWLFLSPISATSFLMSLMGLSSEVNKDIAGLIFNPLLLNYPGSVKNFIEKEIKREPNKDYSFLTGLLNNLDDYSQNAERASGVFELQPSLSHREISQREYESNMRSIFKDAEKNSIIHLFGSKLVLLYGNKSIDHVFNAEGEMKRTEMSLHNFSHSIEMPRFTRLDPLGLDYALDIFRSEGNIHEANT